MQGMPQSQGLVILQFHQGLLQRCIVEVALSPASDHILTQVAEAEFAPGSSVAEIVPDQTLILESIADFGITRQIRAHPRQVRRRAEISLRQIGSAGRGECQGMMGADIPDILELIIIVLRRLHQVNTVLLVVLRYEELNHALAYRQIGRRVFADGAL
jgi:hypothetical protein